MLTRVAVCVISVALLASPPPAYAWGNVGHQVVCEIAWQRLTPGARQMVREIRQGDASSSFARSCTWADAVRKTTHPHTRGYHFVNIPEGQSGVDLARDCGSSARCAPWAIEYYSGIFTDASRPRPERNEALKFVAHFVGDLHQPLHAGRPADVGGNRIRVDFFGDRGTEEEPLSLHAVWDSRILSRAGIGLADAAALNDGISQQQADAWTRPSGDIDLLAWTNESYRLCEDFVYPRLAPNGRIRAAYFDPALTITREQVQKAGARLADLLNRAAAGTLRFAN